MLKFLIVGLVGFWVAPYIADPQYSQYTQIGVLLLLVPIFTLVNSSYGRRGVLAFLSLGMYGLAIESLSITTGFPYGYFTYGDGLGYKLFDLVPWMVFVIWPVLVLAAWEFSRRRWWLAVVSLLVFDLILDPVAVELGMWQWQDLGGWKYFGVPFSNYAGWMFSALVSLLVVRIFRLEKTGEQLRIIWSDIFVLQVVFWSFVIGSILFSV